jgi:iron complex outermembrane receptor protein
MLAATVEAKWAGQGQLMTDHWQGYWGVKKMRFQNVLTWVYGASLTALATAALPVVAQAQAQAESQAAAKEVTDLDELVVTATRVARSGFTAPTPTTVIGEEQLQARAAVNVADVLNEIPAFRATSTSTSGQVGGNFGANYLDLRGLNSGLAVNPIARTLVLVDGHRFVPATTTAQVDINLIPTSLIERTEVVTGGASASWGSDAIAGVANIILKKEVQGFEGSVSGGMTGSGDRESGNINLAAGTNFAGGRGHVMIGGEYDRAAPLPYAQDYNDYTKASWGLVTLPATRAAGLPNFYIDKGFQFGPSVYPGGIITGGPLAGTAFNPDGSTFTFQTGAISSPASQFGGSNAATSNTTNLPVANGLNRWTVMARGDFEISSHATVFAEYTDAKSWQDTRYAGRVLTQPSSASIDNPFMPAAFRATMVSRGLTSATMGRWDWEIGRNVQYNERIVHRGLIGVRGDLVGSWNYDAYFQAGDTRSFWDVANMVDRVNYRAATDPIAGPNGTVVCRSLTTSLGTADPGCVPFNVFGQGSPSAAAIAYVTGRQYWHTFTDQRVASANLRGDPFTLPAGPVSVAVGLEWRRESTRVESDAKSIAQRWDLNNQQPISGEYTVKEAYGEVVVPLLNDVAFIHSAELTGAARRTDYSTAGGVTTWKVGSTIEDSSQQVRLRGTLSRDIRAPNLQELFGAKSFGITTIANPWAGTAGAFVNTQTSGNLLLKPEEAKTYTVGTVVTPKIVPGLRLSVDYYNIDVEGIVASISAVDLVNRCFAGAEDLCQYITWSNPANRASTITLVANNAVNLNKLKTSGFDLEAAYQRSLGQGQLGLRALATNVQHMIIVDTAGAVDRAGSRAFVPKWAFNFAVDYSIGRLSTNLTARVIGKQLYDSLYKDPSDPGYNPALPNTINRNHIPSVTYLNVGAQYELPAWGDGKMTLFGVVNNLTDRMPPEGVGYTGGNTTYDIIGRFIRVGARFNF